MNREDFFIEYSEIVIRALRFSEKTKIQGFLALEENLDEYKVNNRDIFEYGMRFVIDNTFSPELDNILKNIIEQENDKYKKY